MFSFQNHIIIRGVADSFLFHFNSFLDGSELLMSVFLEYIYLYN